MGGRKTLAAGPARIIARRLRQPGEALFGAGLTDWPLGNT
jgi:hypothetical protein